MKSTSRGMGDWDIQAEAFFQDVRFGLRMLRRSPGFTAVAVLTLALGVGANTAVFSIVNAVLLRSLPYRDPDGLVKITFSNPGVGVREVPFSVPELDDLRTTANIFQDVSVVFPASVNLTGSKQPERLELLGVSPNYFSMLGATPQIGRLFGPQDVTLGFATAVVISDALWHRAYGGASDVLGRSVRLDNDLYTIVGVLPPGFRHPGRTVAGDVEVWATAGFSADPFSKPGRSIRQLPGAIGRLKPGLSREQAQARLTSMASQLRNDFATDYPPQAKWTIEIQPLQESLVGDVRRMLLVLMGAVILIVLIVSVNMANLLLARASGRQQEVTVRLALGATRTRIIRQMLTESMILSLIAGIAGTATAAGTLGLVLRFVPSGIPRLSEVGVDWRVLAFGLLISVCTGVLFGLAPAMQTAKTNLSSAMREGSRGSGHSTKSSRVRGALIVSELAIAMVLMVGAGLLLRTLWGLLQANPGFNPLGVVVTSIWLPVPNDPKADPYNGIAPQATFAREVLRRVGTLPGVELVAATSALPATSQTNNVTLAIEDRPVESGQDLRAEVIRVSPDYFRVMQTPLVRGRFFTEEDNAGKEQVAIIDEATANRYWADRDPIGRHVRFGQNPNQPWMTVAGIVKNIKHDTLDVDGVPHIYVSLYQRQGRIMNLVLRTALSPSALEEQVRHEIQAVDPGLPVFNVRSMNDVIDAAVAPRRFSAQLVGVFAGVALLLASVGIYGLLAYMVGQRSREIGLRMALGAQPTDILKLILGRGMLLAAVGIVTGVSLAAAVAPMIATLLYGIHPIDTGVFIAVPLLLLTVVLLASFVPARRAARLDPMLALREE